VSWTLPPLTRPLHLAGPVAVRLPVTPLTPELDVYARLVAVAPDGAARDITNGWLRGAHAELDEQRTVRDRATGAVIRPYHRHDENRSLPIGEPVELDVELWPTAVELPTGTRLRLVVTAEDVPWTVPSSPVAAGQVHPGGHLVLPVDRVTHR
jgi:predicted acyl esterase